MPLTVLRGTDMEPNAGLVRPIGVDEIEAVRARGAEALRLVEEGRVGWAPVSEEVTARIEEAIRAAPKPDRFGWVSSGSGTTKAPE